MWKNWVAIFKIALNASYNHTGWKGIKHQFTYYRQGHTEGLFDQNVTVQG